MEANIKTALLVLAAGTLAYIVFGTVVYSQDNRWADTPPEIREWFKSLENSQGTNCCDESDGHIVESNEYRTNENGWYEVHLPDGKWYPVEPFRLLLQPNKVGKAIVWYVPIYEDKLRNYHITCFMPALFF